MPDISLETIYNSMQDGFKGVHSRIDKVCDTFNSEIEDHEKRITEINTELQVKKAVNGVKKELDAEEKKERDRWKYLIRATTVGALATVTLAAGGAFIKYIVIPAIRAAGG